MARLLGFWVTRDERYEGPARLMNIAKTSGSFVTGKLKSKVWHVQVTELAIIWDRRITNRDQRGSLRIQQARICIGEPPHMENKREEYKRALNA